MVTNSLVVLVMASGLGIVAATPGAAADADPALAAHTPYYTYYRPVPLPLTSPTSSTPDCASNTSKTWCLEDAEYPDADLKHALHHFYYGVLTLYSDATLTTDNSVDGVNTLEEENYLCPSETAYVKPLRAINTEGNWRVIVNSVEVYDKVLTQSARIEECLTTDGSCPLVPECYDTKCLQKSVYQRFLVFDPHDLVFPFAIDTFKLPASCTCFVNFSLQQ